MVLDPPVLAVRTSGPVRGEIPAPPSKSATQRAMLLASLCMGGSILRDPLDAGDTRRMAEALGRLGVVLRRGPDGRLEVRGCGGSFQAAALTLDAGDAGTVLRFLAAAAPLGGGEVRLDGSPRMRQRPIGDLTDALEELGVGITFPGEPGHPPVVLSGKLLGGAAHLRAGRSSQFVSALLMAAPVTDRGMDLTVVGPVVSRPYIDLTLDWMQRFGGPAVERWSEAGGERFRVPGRSGYRPADLRIDGDASSAASLFAAAAVTGGSVRVLGLPERTAHPDASFPELLQEMGCRVERDSHGVQVSGRARRGIRADLRDRPDLAPVLAAVALFASEPTTIEGARHLRWKESDRIADLAAGLRRLGARIDEHEDGITVHPSPLRGARLDPCRDHRLAMAFALAGLRVEGVEIEGPGCVDKSFPGFFAALERLRT